MKNANPISLNSLKGLNTWKVWFLAARPKTLIAGISPVVIGCVIVKQVQPLSLSTTLFCLLFSLFLQIGTNWSNDYFDFLKGADTASRKGPSRAVQSGWISPKAMRNAAIITFSCAIFCAIPLLIEVGLSYLPLAFICVACGFFYTGGKKPLGYLGLGDLLVFIFYGPVATCGTVFAQLHEIPKIAWLSSLAPGFLSCAILCLNNLRDRSEDLLAGKLTLIARFGERFGRIEYLCCLIIPGIVPLLLVLSGTASFYLLGLWILVPLAIKPIRIVFHQQEALNEAFGLTARLLVFYTILYAFFSL